MLGAIIGDIVGSVYEWHNIKTKDFPLFRDGCFFTDDTVMTVAAAEALLNGGKHEDFIGAYKKWGRRYPNAGYGGRFGSWLFSDERSPYNSWGNGSAMRVSPVGWTFPLGAFTREGFDGVLDLARRSAEVTHNHPEGIKGAQATALAIVYARYGRARGEIDAYKAYLRRDLGNETESIFGDKFGYDLNRSLDEIRPAYRFNESCQATVPQAILAFLESNGFEDAIRNAISLGGDSDTLAAITGSIAEAAYGIPQDIADKALTYLDKPLRETYGRWRASLTAGF